jgi:hypothetical protein
MKGESAIEHLHPSLRGPIHEVLTWLPKEGIPFRLLEGSWGASDRLKS